MSLYKLVQHFREYVNSEGVTTLIEIKLRTTQNWLYHLGFKYKDVKKNVFIDGHKQPNIIEDRKKFFEKMEELKPYLVEFNEDGTIKEKNYLANCTVGDSNRRPVIVIIYNECTFSTNDGICKAWTWIGDTFLRPKRQGQGIMISEFLLPFDCFNLLSLSKEKQKKVKEKVGLTIKEAITLFKYGKNNGRY